MFYVPELLTRKGKLSACWFAGNLSERLFKTYVSNKKILAVDIIMTIDEILKVLNSNSRRNEHRFSLYLSSRLMLGVVRLYDYQLNLFQKALSIKVHYLHAVDLDVGTKKKKKTTIELDLDMTNFMTIPEPPRLDFGDLSIRQDVNLLREVSPGGLRRIRESGDEYLPNFGPLTDEETEHFLSTDDRGFGQVNLDDPEALPPPPTDEVFAHPAPVAPSLTDVSFTAVQRAPRKRRASSPVDVRPTKRHRTLEPEIDSVAEERRECSAVILPGEELSSVLPPGEEHSSVLPPGEEHSSGLPPGEKISSVLPLDDELPAVLPPCEELPAALPSVELLDTLPPADNELPPALPILQPKKKQKKRRVRRIDKTKGIATNNRVYDLQAHAVPFQLLSTTNKVPILLMKQNPSTTLSCVTKRLPMVKLRKFSAEVMARFNIGTSGPFVTNTDYPSTSDDFRTKNATIQQASELADKTGSKASDKESTVPETVDSNITHPVDSAQAGIMNEIEAEMISEAPIELGEVTDEQKSESTSKAQPAINDQHPESNLQSEHSEVIVQISNLPLRNEQQLVSSVQPKNAEAIIEIFNSPERNKQQLESSVQPQNIELIVEVSSSQASTRSEEIVSSMWTKPDLEACLLVQLHDNPVILFKNLNPPKTTRRVDAAACLGFLLELAAEKKVVLNKTDQIYIRRAV